MADPLHSSRMDPQDHLRELLDGIACTVCEERVPGDQVRLLARREDLLFLQVECTACGSTALGFLADEALLAEMEREAAAPPVTTDDVLDMHDFLRTWDGDLASLLDHDRRSGEAGGTAGSRAPRAGRS